MNKRTDRLGKRTVNHQGLIMEITKYRNNKDIEVTFVETGEKVQSRYDQFKDGKVTATVFPVKKSTLVMTAVACIGVAGIAVALLVCGIISLFS